MRRPLPPAAFSPVVPPGLLPISTQMGRFKILIILALLASLASPVPARAGFWDDLTGKGKEWQAWGDQSKGVAGSAAKAAGAGLEWLGGLFGGGSKGEAGPAALPGQGGGASAGGSLGWARPASDAPGERGLLPDRPQTKEGSAELVQAGGGLESASPFSIAAALKNGSGGGIGGKGGFVVPKGRAVEEGIFGAKIGSKGAKADGKTPPAGVAPVKKAPDGAPKLGPDPAPKPSPTPTPRPGPAPSAKGDGKDWSKEGVTVPGEGAPAEKKGGWFDGLKSTVGGAFDKVVSAGKTVVGAVAGVVKEVAAVVPRQILPQTDKNRPDFSGVGCKFLMFGCEGVPGAKYEKVEGKVFIEGRGDGRDIHPSDINQGQMGDCYVLAALAGAAHKNPELLRKSIKDNGDGTYDVTLYEKRWWDPVGLFGREAKIVKVDNQFPVQDKNPVLAGYGDYAKGNPELWAMIMEKAYAQTHRNGSYNGIGNGGSPGTAMTAISGKGSGFHLAALSSVDKLAQWDAEGQAISVGTKPDILTKNDPLYTSGKLVPGHAYWVESIDKEKKTVTIGNPWGWYNEHVTLTEDEFKGAFLTVYTNEMR